MDSPDEGNARSAIFDFVVHNPVAVLSTISGKVPSGAVIYVSMRTDLTCYFETRDDTQKARDLTEHPAVAVTFFNQATLETVQMQALASVVSDATDIQDIRASLRSITGKEMANRVESGPVGDASKIGERLRIPPVGQLEKGAYVYIKLVPHRARYRRYDAQGRPGGTFTEYSL